MRAFIILLLLITTSGLFAQSQEFEASDEFPFGKPNKEAEANVTDFEGMIGLSDCKSLMRNQDGTWQDTLQMVWKFKYILNGTAVQDETWHASGFYATSIRQYNKTTKNWVVTYASSNSVSNTVGVWLGNKEEDEIILKQDQKAPNGMDGVSRLTFHNISDEGFDWKGEWVDTTGSIVYPFWKIYCTKRD